MTGFTFCPPQQVRRDGIVQRSFIPAACSAGNSDIARSYRQSSSASRFTAGAFGFLTLIQC